MNFTMILLLFVLQIDRNNTQLSSNATTVLNEIEEMHTRLTNVLKERTEFLKSSVDKYLIVESKTLKDLKENLELELANIKVSQWKVPSEPGVTPSPPPPVQCIESMLRWRFWVHASKCPEIYLDIIKVLNNIWYFKHQIPTTTGSVMANWFFWISSER